MPEQKRNRKRNNFTLSEKAQEVINKQSNKSKFVSEAIVIKEKIDKGQRP